MHGVYRHGMMKREVDHLEEPSNMEKEDMARYFTREEAEELLPQISVILRDIQRERAVMREIGRAHV